MAKRQLEKKEGALQQLEDFQAEKFKEENPELFAQKEKIRAEEISKAAEIEKPVQVVAKRTELARKEELARQLKVEKRLERAKAQVKKLTLVERLREQGEILKEFVKDQFPQSAHEGSVSEIAAKYLYRLRTPPEWKQWELWLPYDEFERMEQMRRPLNIMGKVKRFFVGKKKKEK